MKKEESLLFFFLYTYRCKYMYYSFQILLKDVTDLSRDKRKKNRKVARISTLLTLYTWVHTLVSVFILLVPMHHIHIRHFCSTDCRFFPHSFQCIAFNYTTKLYVTVIEPTPKTSCLLVSWPTDMFGLRSHSHDVLSYHRKLNSLGFHFFFSLLLCTYWLRMCLKCKIRQALFTHCGRLSHRISRCRVVRWKNQSGISIDHRRLGQYVS